METSDRTRVNDDAADVREGYRQTVVGTDTAAPSYVERKGGNVPSIRNCRRGPSGLYCVNVDWMFTCCGHNAPADGSVSARLYQAGDGIESFRPDAGMFSSEIQVLEIRSMVTASIRAASSLFRGEYR